MNDRHYNGCVAHICLPLANVRARKAFCAIHLRVPLNHHATSDRNIVDLTAIISHPSSVHATLSLMNRTELRTEVQQFAEKAKQATGRPKPTDVDKGRELLAMRKEHLSDQLSSNVKVKYCEEPDWGSWTSIAKAFSAYHAAIVELQNKSAGPLAKIRLQGT